jgi:hypothetical protein
MGRMHLSGLGKKFRGRGRMREGEERDCGLGEQKREVPREEGANRLKTSRQRLVKKPPGTTFYLGYL